MKPTTTLHLNGLALAAPATALPRLFQPAARAAAANLAPADADLLPADLIEVEAVVDLAAAARSGGDTQAEQVLSFEPGQVLVLELADGSSLVTTAEQLLDNLSRLDPDTVDDASRSINLPRALADRGIVSPDRSLGSAFKGLQSVVSRVFKLSLKPLADSLVDEAREHFGAAVDQAFKQLRDTGVSALGTRALMWAIERKARQNLGLNRWDEQGLVPVAPDELARLAQQGPLLLFIHGTGSSTLGSFGDLRETDRDYWSRLRKPYGERVLAFEHCTLSASPIENALDLLTALPRGARVHLVTHSRGGLVGDLLCLESFEPAIAAYGQAAASPGQSAEVQAQIDLARREQIEALQRLQDRLRLQQVRVERYVRVACPARGTLLAGDNFDVFLSGLLRLIGLVPALQVQPLYAAFKRVVLEIARNRVRPDLVPGIEAMLPDSPLGRLLLEARPGAGTRLGLVSGDHRGSGLSWLGSKLVDWTLFDGEPNDLVVDTDSMSKGIAPALAATQLCPTLESSHFGYFSNDLARRALLSWLASSEPAAAAGARGIRRFVAEPGVDEETRALRVRQRQRGSDPDAGTRPIVILLPGIMGTHLWVNRKDRVWIDPLQLTQGGIRQIAWDRPHVSEEKLVSLSYGGLCEHLSATHEVLRFPYDWRQPLDVLGERFGATLKQALDASQHPPRPVRVLAHSMGGLVARSVAHLDPALWARFMERPGARFVMLGTPNQGSYAMVETLIGKDSMIRKLGRYDFDSSLQKVLNTVAGFRGALQLLPRAGFIDATGEATPDFFQRERWSALKADMRDFWFGDKVCAEPEAAALHEGSWLWRRDGAAPGLPPQYQDRVDYVFGCAPRTPCGLVQQGGRWKMLATPEGDGTVSWKSGAIGGIGQHYYMPTGHGSLADESDYFDSLTRLLERGDPGELLREPPRKRGQDLRPLISYDAGPAPWPTAEELSAGIFGGSRRTRVQRSARPTLKARVRAMDLRGVDSPVMVGHYDEDPIAGAESVLDSAVVQGELRVRHDLGLYAGRLGTASAVLVRPNAYERALGSLRGAVVTGLGKYDGTLSGTDLTTAVRTGALRYLLHLKEMLDAGSGGDVGDQATLSTVLLGYNSAVNVSIVDSVSALLRGVVEANRKFAELTRSNLRIAALDIVELYLDTAISAAHALNKVARSLNEDTRLGVQIEAQATLDRCESAQPRLADSGRGAYWPRLIVTAEGQCPEHCKPVDGAPSGPQATDRLRFLMLGQRARAENVLQQRQPGLVEHLVQQQIDRPEYDPDLSRSLFQLLIPHDFKEAARQIDRMVMVLDPHTATLPWELMQADEEPLATRVAMVRQLSTTAFRTQVNQAATARAYVLGNPAVEGFGRVFVDEHGQPYPDPPLLAGAENEARTVASLLAGYGFEVRQDSRTHPGMPGGELIGPEVRANDAINALFRHPYRIVHIAAHGVHEELGADGQRRSGVVLSDGRVLSAAEFGSLEAVPELVFLNCCHLGRMSADATPLAPGHPAHAAYNRLAYSTARSLIDLGVRAVVAAGWAVGDESGEVFAKTFYDALLGDRLNFGEAVARARRETWLKYPADNTWGAYQAYGDPGWSIDPRAQRQERETLTLVAVDEFLVRLDALRSDIRRRGSGLPPSDARACAKKVERWLDLLPADWRGQAAVHGKLGELYADLGPAYYEQACTELKQALAATDTDPHLSLAAAGQLANLDARLGEFDGDLERIERARTRLLGLVAVLSPGADGGLEQAGEERCNLVGSTYKSEAAIHADRLVQQPREAASHRARLLAALQGAEQAYRIHAGSQGAALPRRYATLNWLHLQALTTRPRNLEPLLQMARDCRAACAREGRDRNEPWFAIGMVDADLALALLSGDLARAGEEGEALCRTLQAAYQAALEGEQSQRRDVDSILRQLLFLARISRTGLKPLGAADGLRLSQRLFDLADGLMPEASAPWRTSTASRVSKPKLTASKPAKAAKRKPR